MANKTNNKPKVTNESESSAQKTYKAKIELNNPLKYGYTHEYIISILSKWKVVIYWCLCDEIGEHGTPHTHFFIYCPNKIPFSQIKNAFPEAHIETAYGSLKDCRNYIRKEGKWANNRKAVTNLIETFEESGEVPANDNDKVGRDEDIFNMIEEGKSVFQIVKKYKNSVTLRKDSIEKIYQEYWHDKYRNILRDVEVTIISGISIDNKYDGISKKYGRSKVYKINNYINPFDEYCGEEIIVFDYFDFSNLRLFETITYLKGDLTMFPCRTINRVARHTKVFILSEKELFKYFNADQKEYEGYWHTFLTQINKVICCNYFEKQEYTIKEYLELKGKYSSIEIIEAMEKSNSKKISTNHIK